MKKAGGMKKAVVLSSGIDYTMAMADGVIDLVFGIRESAG